MDLPCHRCHAPAMTRDAAGRDWCMRCVADEGAARQEHVTAACRALAHLPNHDDLVREVLRRQRAFFVAEGRLPFEDGPEYEGLMQ